MDKAKDIKEELLKQMDGYSVKTTDVIATSARKIIGKHKTQLRRKDVSHRANSLCRKQVTLLPSNRPGILVATAVNGGGR